MANQWLRLWHDMPNDPKWRTVAKVAGQPIASVISVYVHLLVSASENATERGRTQMNHEDIASALDIEIAAVEAILAAMQGRVLDGDRLSGWSERQPSREDGSAERSKAWREAKKAEQEEERKRTQANDQERKRTQDKEEDKDKKKNKTFSSDDLAVAEFIWEGVQALSSNQKPPNLEAWANTVRLMYQRDSRTHDEIRSLFAWANQHHFWKSNVLGPDKLRDQFDRLTIQRAEESKNATNRPIAIQSAADRRAAIAAETYEYAKATDF